MSESAPPAEPAAAAKTTRVVTDRPPHDSEEYLAESREQETPAVVNKLSECVEIERDAEDVYYVGTSGLKATEIDGLDDMPNLQRLHIRSNLLTSMEGIASLTQLQHLELYDNQIERISSLDALVNLRVLDLSFNAIRSLPDLGHLTQLEELYVANNKLKRVAGLAGLRTLKKLDLGANRLREIRGLDALVALEQLWLGKNKIEKIEGLEALAKLRVISVQSNRLVKIEGLEANIALEELYLSHNGIEVLEGVGHLTKLTTLDVGANRVAAIPAELQTLTQLEDLWLNDNRIAHWGDAEQLVPLRPSLRTLYLERNPLAKEFEYRMKLETLLPELEQIDAVPTTKARRLR